MIFDLFSPRHMNSPMLANIATTVHPALIIAGPLLVLAFGLVPDRVSNPIARRFARNASLAAIGTFVLACVSTIGLAISGPVNVGFEVKGPVRIDFLFDTLSAIMLLLVSFLGAVVIRFSGNYLAGDLNQGRFTRWMCLTVGSVLILTISGNFLMFTLAWIATSLSLHKLLTFYSDRPAARLSANKKFMISRLGDAALIGALFATYQCFGTWEFSKIFSASEIARAQSENANCVGLSAFLLVIGALLKSAQFPFHSWLPDTMESPTPVSALMHAGIVNAGGFLVVRFSPIITFSTASLNALALVGAFTALFASVIMLPQTSVKRSLAYSTIAQMGFMMLQCGLGAFALAILHLVAHSLYKAYAFLSSGSIVSISKSAWTPSERPSARPFVLLSTLVAAVGLTFAIGSLFGAHASGAPGVLLLGSIFIMALVYLLWNLWSSSHSSSLIISGLVITSITATAYFSVHTLFGHLLANVTATHQPDRSTAELVVMALVGLAFMAVLVLQSQLPGWSTTRLGRKIYVHASHGFYISTIFNRLTLALFKKSHS